MSLDKAIEHGKEFRKQYRGSKKFDRSCRENRCPYCLSNVMINDERLREKADDMLRELSDAEDSI